MPGRLLRTERDVFMPLLRATPEERFALRTACPGWTVRDVLAHCGAALVRIVEGRLEPGVFSPASNAADVAERAGWPLARVLDELERGFTEAGPVIAAGDGRLDGVALGEWVHAGDVRDAFGVPGAYAGEGAEAALELLVMSAGKRGTPLLRAELLDGDDGNGGGHGGGGRTLELGVAADGRPPARLTCDVPTLIRLYAGRSLVGTRYELEGAAEGELAIYT
ncbi:MDMPI_N domain containing protein [Streptomyces chattanoogensis]|uniref:MDMPI_N domain containing protein n=2 Tax=Streptomyces chattanoogensis TaxID=66876 RepID=A0A0N0XZK9_9ACTN|nr:maleylpyruvate isomerase family mycothiol-dependent enzyme [Streptomyces chattanoogensis]KPC66413.1 MDMPI_N domain containing protein [Streptomyces chattanoogensis]